MAIRDKPTKQLIRQLNKALEELALAECSALSDLNGEFPGDELIAKLYDNAKKTTRTE